MNFSHSHIFCEAITNTEWNVAQEDYLWSALRKTEMEFISKRKNGMSASALSLNKVEREKNIILDIQHYSNTLKEKVSSFDNLEKIHFYWGRKFQEI